jgi:hypothetical protein
MDLCISDEMPGSQHATTIHRVRRCASLLLAFAALAGCGGGVDSPTPPPPASKAKVALLQAPKRQGEVIVRGEASPASHGPFTFEGRYVVRFEQFAPEDPRLDFTGQTAFVASVDRHADRRTLTLHGRLYVDVSFGDFPYALRFTPAH